MSNYNMFLKEESRRLLESIVFEILNDYKSIVVVDFDYFKGKNSCRVEFGDFNEYSNFSNNKEGLEKQILEEYNSKKSTGYIGIVCVDNVIDIQYLFQYKRVNIKNKSNDLSEKSSGDFKVLSADSEIKKIFENIKKNIKKNKH